MLGLCVPCLNDTVKGFLYDPHWHTMCVCVCVWGGGAALKSGKIWAKVKEK